MFPIRCDFPDECFDVQVVNTHTLRRSLIFVAVKIFSFDAHCGMIRWMITETKIVDTSDNDGSKAIKPVFRC